MKTVVVLARVFASGQNKDRESDLSECNESVLLSVLGTALFPSTISSSVAALKAQLTLSNH
jgi:hypothetical protein